MPLQLYWIRDLLNRVGDLLDAGVEVFRDFVFANPARLWTSMNPSFFNGTVVEGAVNGLLKGR